MAARKKAKAKTLSAYKVSVLKIAKKYGATKVKVFGSYARNQQRKNSDLDLLVQMPKKSTLLHMSGLKQDLQQSLKKKVDVVTYDSIKPSLRSGILREAKSL